MAIQRRTVHIVPMPKASQSIRERRIVVAILVGACVFAAIVSSRGSGRACAPVLTVDGGVVYLCEPPR